VGGEGLRYGFCRVKDSIEPEALRARWVVCEVWADRWVEGWVEEWVYEAYEVK
jgi:hypothetical protein